MNNYYTAFEAIVKNKCKTHAALIPTKTEKVLKLDNGDEEITILLQDGQMVVKYRSHFCMKLLELLEFNNLARMWQNHYAYKQYCLSILIGQEDWFFEEKKTKILGLINGMNVEQ